MKNFLDEGRIKIAHLADVHIKDNRREEYSNIFKKLYAQLRLESPDVIAICGDIFHDKTKASAHNYLDVADFLSTLTQIAPVVLIPGNHDLNVKVPGGPDLISPVVSNHTILNAPRFIYWRHSGVYAAYGVIWIVIAPDGLHPSLNEIEETALRYNLKNTAWICLIHETIDGSLLYNETLLRERRLAPKDLVIYDAVLAGDIHLQQNIGESQRAMYAGSLIQQNIGESHTGHGFLVWELELSSNHSPYRTVSPKIRQVNIPNEQGFLRVRLKAGQDITKRPLPTKPNYYEIIHDETTTQEELAFHMDLLTKIYGIPPQAVRLELLNEKTIENNFSALSQAQIDAQSPETHQEIIRDILGEKHPYLQKVIEFHQQNYSTILNQERTRARIRLLKLKFSNIYCYGRNNLIDFTKLENSLSGAVAPNRAGKSSLIDIIVFALYDEYPRAEKKLNIINNHSSQYYLLLEFELGGKRGYIEKKGSGKKNLHSGQYKFVYDNQELTQGTNTQTCQEIEKLVGTYANAELTSILHQDSQKDFVRLKSGERKQSLARLLALGSFEKLEKETKEEGIKLNERVKVLQENFQGKKIAKLVEEREAAINSSNKEKIKVRELDKKIESQEKKHRKFIEKKEQLSINLARIQDKIKSLGPELFTNLKEAEAELEKTLKMVKVDNELSPSDECNAYLLFDASFANNVDLDSLKIPTHDEVLNIVNRAQLTQKNKKEKEPEILAEITHLETEKSRISTLLETSKKCLQESCPKLQIDFKTLEIEIPSIERPKEQESPWPTIQKGSRPTHEEILEAENNLVDFCEKKDSVRDVILRNLAVVSNNLVSPIQDEKKGEFEGLLASTAKDQEIVSNKNLLEITFQAAKLKLQNVQSVEKTQRKDLLKKVKQNPWTTATENLRFLDTIILQQEITDTKVKLLAAENAQQMLRQLKLKAGCSGCEYTKSLFTEDKVETIQRYLEDVLLESAALAVYNTHLAEKEVNKLESDLRQIEITQKRVERLAEIQNQRAKIADYEVRMKKKNYWQQKMKSLEILEKAAYWWQEDNKVWKEYDSAITQAENIRNLQQELISVSQKLSESKSLLKELARLESETFQMEKEFISLRKLGLERVKSASQKVEMTKEFIKVQAERQKLKIKHQLVEEKLTEWKRRIVSSKNELAELRLQRDKIMNFVATTESEIKRIDKSLEEERKRINLLTETQEKINIITAYRGILNPKTGIADYLLKKSRFYLEDAVNSVLGECRALFQVYISDEFELSISSNNHSQQQSKKLLSAKLGSGYQKFVLSLVFRTALWKLAEVPLLNCQFIDEGFGCCDEDNLETVIQYLMASVSASNAPQIIFIVSHVERLKNAIQQPLFINIELSGSKVNNEN
ncbi:metallophosphoesterase [endosymbiont GvMRE of Glomus versiforme]|uniref:metallophosphoesterase n=1 Tax=endosymbiont GvMRE of Glomus versiforme TaxID=2039283 RepID=UPI000ECD47F2|nr:metallophosphoesterase [endosymbiont GvMRE of Glomus versiforme]RHZ35300.1 DNA repair exonuclease SbcCD ATPase subunit [endosymbiont GvMRE of Glomus versiforme]